VLRAFTPTTFTIEAAMTQEDFDGRVREAMATKSKWFASAEPPVHLEAVAKVEAELGQTLPDEFKHFAVTFGGGYFGGVNISTLDEGSDWYVLSRPSLEVNGRKMLVISDDESGGYYGFLSDGINFEQCIAYINRDDRDHKDYIAPSFFDFVENFALSI
jgi:hypothetical protein